MLPPTGSCYLTHHPREYYIFIKRFLIYPERLSYHIFIRNLSKLQCKKNLVAFNNVKRDTGIYMVVETPQADMIVT